MGPLFVLLTALGWGIGWPMMKLAMHDWPPLFARGVAGMAGAMGLTLVALLRRETLLPTQNMIWRLLLGALTNVFAWMGFTALSLLWLRVSEAALLTFTMPIWTALLAWPMLGERPRARSLI